MTTSTPALRSSHLIAIAALLGALAGWVAGAAAPAIALGVGCVLAITAGLSKTCTP